MGVPVVDHVTLRASIVGTTGTQFHRIDPYTNGALTEEFVVPADAMFVLTDIQLLRFHSETPGVVSSYRLDFIKEGAWMHAYYYVQGITDSEGTLFVEKSLKAGLVLAPGTRIKITGFDSSPDQPFGTLIGYLVQSN